MGTECSSANSPLRREAKNRKFETANVYVPTIIDWLVKRKEKGRKIQKMKKEDTVKLISAEGFEFVVDKEAAMVSQTIHNMLTSPGSFAERQHGEVTFPEISTTILEKICQYFYWHLQFARFSFL
uniref:Elongin-C n=2 Tax=Phaseolus vulgaris TaxID=3885 RepID=V7C0D3_PHAVU|nr:hypothetical protein PHAVU_005G146900g [Phaseolus vulgaris]ESW22351.1 hypothetical protein PHAVU_005G146900g [Phaseolus vulgaris]